MGNKYIGAIESFKHHIPNIQRASLFDVSIPNFKYSVNNNGSRNGILLKFSVKNAPFPESTVGDITVNYMGRTVHFYGDRSYGGDWATTVILDGRWGIYNDLYAWNQALNGANRIVSEDINSHGNFKVDAFITAYTTDGAIARRAKLHGLWIKSIGELSFDWTSTDNAVDLSVTWTYDYVTNADFSTSNKYTPGEDENNYGKDSKGNLNKLEGVTGRGNTTNEYGRAGGQSLSY